MHARAGLIAAAALAGLLACGDDETADAGRPDAGRTDAGRDAAADDAGPPPDPCEALFGTPNERTGLSEARCRPACGCGADAYVPPRFDAAGLAALREYRLEAPPALLDADPYDTPAPPLEPDASCAVTVTDPATGAYRLETFASREAAEAAGATPTHTGPCGQCSSLVDLAVYAGEPDLTAPVRRCALDAFGDFDALRACLEGLGFTPPCAQIWAYNAEHTRERCGASCIRLLDAPYHTPDGALNECLACDERESGPVFKAVAGRTRRNSGLPNAMCRPCAEVVPFAHDYPPLP